RREDVAARGVEVDELPGLERAEDMAQVHDRHRDVSGVRHAERDDAGAEGRMSEVQVKPFEHPDRVGETLRGTSLTVEDHDPLAGRRSSPPRCPAARRRTRPSWKAHVATSTARAGPAHQSASTAATARTGTMRGGFPVMACASLATPSGRSGQACNRPTPAPAL